MRMHWTIDDTGYEEAYEVYLHARPPSLQALS